MTNAAQDPDELLPVVDENDQFVAYKPRRIIHREKLLHRAVHVLYFNDLRQIYLQKRSTLKDSSPGKWDSSSSGHVDPGEDYQQAAERELMEELNIQKNDLKWIGKLVASPSTGMEFSGVFATTGSQEPKPNPVEIEYGKWFPIEKVDEWIALEPDAFAPCFKEVWKHYRNSSSGKTYQNQGNSTDR